MSTAVVSCLGVSGWGPLHWWLPCDADPEALLARLRRAWLLAASAGAVDPRAALLLASLLRSSSDLMPLAAAQPPSGQVGLLFRHRLVCRPGQPWLHLRSWTCHAAAVSWRVCGPERCLDLDLLSQPGRRSTGGRSRVWLPSRLLQTWPQEPIAGQICRQPGAIRGAGRS